jgi:hypothetical protein
MMIKLLHRQHGFVFAILLMALSVTTVVWSTNIMTSVSLLESTKAATNPDDDIIQATIPENLYQQQQNAPIRYNKDSNKKRPWNQPDLRFTLKMSAADGSSSSRGGRINRPKRIKYPYDKVENEEEDQNEEEDDDAKEETQIRAKTKKTRAKKKAKTKTKKKKRTRKKKRRSER